MLRHLRPALMMLALMTLLTGVLYPLVVTVIGQALFPSQANGSLIERNGKTVGSSLIGQQFTSPRYFWSRPSATSPFPYNASSSLGSNLGPLNPALYKAAEDRIGLLRAADSTNGQPIPADLVTSSGSGLDPLQMAQMREVIRRAGHDSTVLLSSHLLSEVTNVCGRAIVLDEGVIRYDGTMDALLRGAASLRLMYRGDAPMMALFLMLCLLAAGVLVAGLVVLAAWVLRRIRK